MIINWTYGAVNQDAQHAYGSVLNWSTVAVVVAFKPGPFIVQAAQVAVPGAIACQVAVPGAVKGQTATPGAIIGQVTRS